MSIAYRPLETNGDFRQFVELQRDTWGQDFTELVPVTIGQIAQKVGGVVAGGFEGERMLGFVFGISGPREGRLVHWSHMLAVREDAQGRGIGPQLKWYQRGALLDLGIHHCYWTYDPLVAKNAHLNFNLLGARPDRYVIDMYGSDTGSDVHSGLGTDRLIVHWELDASQVTESQHGRYPFDPEWSAAPLANGWVDDRDPPTPVHQTLPEAPTVRIEIPLDIQGTKRERPDDSLAWRATSQRAFLHYLDRGFSVHGFYRHPTTHRCFYVLIRAS